MSVSTTLYIALLGLLSIQESQSWTPTQIIRTTRVIGRPYPLAVVRVTPHLLQMSLLPLPVDTLEDLLVVGTPSGLQYATYWGRTKREKYNRFLESAIVTVLGVFFSYFMSFVVGGFVATILGGLFAFWGVLSPDLKSRQRNYELLAGRRLVDPWTVNDYDEENQQGLYGSLFMGRVGDVCVVEDTAAEEEYDLEDFDDYTMETDELEQLAGTPYLIRVRLSDNEGRELQIHARMNEEYLDIQPGMPVATILLSKSQSFSTLAALTDVHIPEANCWVGDYPYLNRPEMEALLENDYDLRDSLRGQGRKGFVEGNGSKLGKDASVNESDSAERETVKILRRRGRGKPL